MDFSLRYKGPLPANSGAHEKHEIRRAFHPQVRSLWNEHPLLTGAATIPLLGFLKPHPDRAEANARDRMFKATRVEWIAKQHERGSFYFAPLVSQELDLHCSLDISSSEGRRLAD